MSIDAMTESSLKVEAVIVRVTVISLDVSTTLVKHDPTVVHVSDSCGLVNVTYVLVPFSTAVTTYLSKPHNCKVGSLMVKGKNSYGVLLPGTNEPVDNDGAVSLCDDLGHVIDPVIVSADTFLSKTLKPAP